MMQYLENWCAKHRSSFVSVFLWLVLCVCFFSPAVFNNKVIAPMDCLECYFRPFADAPIEETHNHFVSDGVSQYLPYKWAIKKSFQEDGYVGWDPLTFNGRPIANNTMASPGDPWNLMYAILPFWSAWDWGIISQFFIAGCGMILLMRFYKMPIWAVLLAAVSFSLYSQYVLWMYHKWLGAMIWSPFLVWALLKYRNRLLNFPAIIFLALLWRTGSLQSCTFGFLIVAFVWLAELWENISSGFSVKFGARLSLSYLIVGIAAALLTLDVFVDTFPLLGGCKDMGFFWGFSNILTAVTLLFPTSLGIPETLDIAKAFGFSLFDIKFGGGVVFILALIACFNGRAPRVAKVLFIASFVAACTPLVTYIYSRSTIIMALGMSWLAAWQLYDFTQVRFNSAYWCRIVYALVAVLVLWLVASCAIIGFKEELYQILIDMMRAASGVARQGRLAWQELRVERFLSQILIWNWRNLLLIICLLLGLYCCSNIRPGRRNSPWMAAVVLLTYVELVLFSSTWITYSRKPESGLLFNAPAWMPELREHVKDGSLVAFSPTEDVQFLLENTLSAYGIRMAFGYETFIPPSIAPLRWDSSQSHSCVIRPLRYDNAETEDFALAGISHVMSDVRWGDVPLPGWKLVMQEKDFKLYANPDFKGRYFLDENMPVKANWRTCNRINLTIPAHSRSLTVLESFHSGWKAYAGEKELPIVPTERGGMQIALPTSESEYELLLEFHMLYRFWCYSIMIAVCLILGLIHLKQK